MAESTYTLKGMTCGHCVASVTEEVAGIEGVQNVDVDVDLATGTVTSGEPVPVEKVAAAVTEAGYELVS